MSSSEELTIDDVMEVGCRMAQELQEIVDDAVACGSDCPSARALINDFDEINNRWNSPWQKTILSVFDSDAAGLINLKGVNND